MPVADLGPALAAGELDAVMAAEPLLSKLEQAGYGTIWRRSDTVIPNHLTAALMLNGRFHASQSEAARRLATGYLKALRLYNDAFVKRSGAQRAELVQILSQMTTLDDPSRLERMVMPGINPNGMVNIQTLRLDQQYFLIAGLQQKEIDLAALVEPQYVAFAITQLGEYR